MSTPLTTENARQGACRASRPKHASRRARHCRSHDRASAQVRAPELRTRVGGSRFLQTDPIEGGSANDYDYANADPINTFDLTGERPPDDEHTKGKRKSTKGKHQKGQARKKADRGGEKGDARRRDNPNKRRSEFSTTPTVRGEYLSEQEAARSSSRSSGGRGGLHWPSLPSPPSWVPGGAAGGVIVACIWFCIPTPWPVL